jgi:hypothetical protein
MTVAANLRSPSTLIIAAGPAIALLGIVIQLEVKVSLLGLDRIIPAGINELNRSGPRRLEVRDQGRLRHDVVHFAASDFRERVEWRQLRIFLKDGIRQEKFSVEDRFRSSALPVRFLSRILIDIETSAVLHLQIKIGVVQDIHFCRGRRGGREDVVFVCLRDESVIRLLFRENIDRDVVAPALRAERGFLPHRHLHEKRHRGHGEGRREGMQSMG